jgi:ubiquinone/menaquinone biosynthesis C-methylase UbiE
MPFDDSSVDLVWREHVLQHLTDTQAAIDEIGRVLRPGGRCCWSLITGRGLFRISIPI